MNLFSIRPATRADCAEILALHEQNHVQNLAEEERQNGFVTLQLQLSQIEALATHGGLFVARLTQQDAPQDPQVLGGIAGYVLAAPWNFYEAWPMFRVQTDRFPLRFQLGGVEHELRRDNSFQYGPVCVAPAFRGQNVLPALFHAVKERYASRFEIGATFIDARNARSLEAHRRKLGFGIVDEWAASGNRYFTLAFETRV